MKRLDGLLATPRRLWLQLRGNPRKAPAGGGARPRKVQPERARRPAPPAGPVTTRFDRLAATPHGTWLRLRGISRQGFVMGCFLAVALLLCWHAVDLQLSKGAFLQDKGQERYEVVQGIEAHRGMITDRNGEPLAISTPVASVWGNFTELSRHKDRWKELARLLDMSPDYLNSLISERPRKSFYWIKRQVGPGVAAAVKAAAIPGVNLVGEYRRYYPAGEVVANLMGFTNLDDQGQEGVELAFDPTLRGTNGSNRVIRDRLGRAVEHVERIRDVQPGQDLALSIDRRLQYVAYRELRNAVQKFNAAGGLMVVLDAQTGELLAMVNLPTYNPNNRTDVKPENFRNRSVTDLFEPGSTIKPFTVAAGLETGRFTPTTVVDTQNGVFQSGKKTIKDVHGYASLTVAGIIQKSSNVGVIKIALAIEPEPFWQVLSKSGFGETSSVELPGEQQGQLDAYRNWGMSDRVSLAFGYHTNLTAVQLARAYGVFASGGMLRPVTILKRSTPPSATRVVSQKTADAVRDMMKAVTEEGGTAVGAAVAGYTVAGKTGTVKRTSSRGYEEKSYRSVFAGFLPASAPRLIGVVVVDDPQGPVYYGGLVAGPVFATVMAEAARIFNLTPDRPVDAQQIPPRFAEWLPPPTQVAVKSP